MQRSRGSAARQPFLVTAVAGVCSVVAAAAFGQTPLSSQTIADAIEKGLGGGERRLVATCDVEISIRDYFRDGVTGADRYRVAVALSAGRIAMLAASAKKLYKSFVASDVPAELRTNALFVEAIPLEVPVGFPAAPAAIEHVVLKARNGKVAQPGRVDMERIDSSTTVVSGSTPPPNKALARFEVGHVEELPAGDVEVVLITTHGERKCKIGAKDRDRLLNAR